jgi:hypothetical protein
LQVFAQPLSAQEKKPKVAVFDPVGAAKSNDEEVSIVVREMVSAAIVNTGKYNIVERSLIDHVLKEQEFSNSGIVDESQVSAIGKLAGANKVVLSVLSSAGSDKVMLSLKIIDVESASVESQKIKVMKPDALLDEITPLALALIGESDALPSDFLPSSSSSSQAKSGEVTLEFPGVAYSKNPTVRLLVDGQPVGSGTLNQGFTIRFTDTRPGRHTVKAEWSGLIASRTHTINTAARQRYTFEYAKTGFGYVFQLKK